MGLAKPLPQDPFAVLRPGRLGVGDRQLLDGGDGVGIGARGGRKLQAPWGIEQPLQYAKARQFGLLYIILHVLGRLPRALRNSRST